jgi:hypothetical protein
MPGNKKTSERQGGKTAISVADDSDDFDKMLAEVTAADSELSADARASTATTTNITSSIRSSSERASSPVLQVSENAIAGACKRGDITQLRRWGQQGVRVSS